MFCYDNVLYLRKELDVCDIVLFGENRWDNCALYLGEDRVIATLKGVVKKVWLADIIMPSKVYAVLRIPGLQLKQKLKLSEVVANNLGKLYNPNKPDDGLNCSRLLHSGINGIKPGHIEVQEDFTLWSYYNNREKFALILEK